MKIHRFFIEAPITGAGESYVITSSGVTQQIRSVLKLLPGERIEVCNGKGTFAAMRIVKINARAIECVVEQVGKAGEPVRPTAAYIALIKRDKFELVVQKLTELGVAKIVPIITARTIKTSLNIERLQTIAREAAELSGRVTLPEIVEPLPLAKAFAAQSEATFFHTGVQAVPGQRLASAFFIGPEGGWSDDEVVAASRLYGEPRSLGPLVLRAETAAIIAGYLTIHSS